MITREFLAEKFEVIIIGIFCLAFYGLFVAMYDVLGIGKEELLSHGFLSYQTLIICLLFFYLAYIFYIFGFIRDKPNPRFGFFPLIANILLFVFIFVIPGFLVTQGDYEILISTVEVFGKESIIQYILTFISIGIIGSSLLIVAMGQLRNTDMPFSLKLTFYLFSIVGVISFVYCSLVSSMVVHRLFNQGFIDSWLIGESINALFWGCAIFLGWILIWYISLIQNLTKDALN